MSSTVKQYGFIAVLKKPLTDEEREEAGEVLYDEKVPLGLTYAGDLVYVDWNLRKPYGVREDFYGLNIGSEKPAEGETKEDFLSLLAQRSFEIEAGTVRPYSCIYYNGSDSPLDEMGAAKFMEMITS